MFVFLLLISQPSSNQPWCNGAHAETGMTPTVVKVEASGPKAMCTCKLTKNPQGFCDGSHRALPAPPTPLPGKVFLAIAGALLAFNIIKSFGK